MRALIYSAGPSLPRYRSVRDPGALTLAVNTAIEQPWLWVDWWCVMDQRCLCRPGPAYPRANPLQGVVTMRENIGRLRDPDSAFPYVLPAKARAVSLEELSRIDVGLRSYTLTMAILWAYTQGATTIQCLACDWSGETDASGWNQASGRNPERWARERAEFERCRKSLAAAGVTLERVPPPATEDET